MHNISKYMWIILKCSLILELTVRVGVGVLDEGIYHWQIEPMMHVFICFILRLLFFMRFYLVMFSCKCVYRLLTHTDIYIYILDRYRYRAETPMFRQMICRLCKASFYVYWSWLVFLGGTITWIRNLNTHICLGKCIWNYCLQYEESFASTSVW